MDTPHLTNFIPALVLSINLSIAKRWKPAHKATIHTHYIVYPQIVATNFSRHSKKSKGWIKFVCSSDYICIFLYRNTIILRLRDQTKDPRLTSVPNNLSTYFSIFHSMAIVVSVYVLYTLYVVGFDSHEVMISRHVIICVMLSLFVHSLQTHYIIHFNFNIWRDK